MPPPSKPVLIAMAVGIIFTGSVLGFLLSRIPSQNKTLGGLTTTPAMIKTDSEIGSTDTKTFRDSAIGVINKGGLNGEGTHNLTRDGGPSKTLYLVSSVVDLDEFVDKKVEVWGETVKASKVPWLMDVGRIKFLQ